MYLVTTINTEIQGGAKQLEEDEPTTSTYSHERTVFWSKNTSKPVAS